jgi:glycosyltransferase involved in cell wall biosynthesis
MTTKVSIITTCFNAEKTIAETIESIHANKGDFEIEHIITDAGSTDRTHEIVKSYGDKIKLIITPGLNQSQGINYGLKIATGEILTFLNADDLYYPDTIQTVVNQFNNYPNRLWQIGFCPIIDENSIERDSWISTYKNFWISNYNYFYLLLENYICQPATFFRKKLLEENGYFSETENLCMDYEYWLRIGKKNKPIITKKALAKFRRMQNTKSNSSFEIQFKDDKRIAIEYAKKHGFIGFEFLKYLFYLKTVLIYRRIYK